MKISNKLWKLFILLISGSLFAISCQKNSDEASSSNKSSTTLASAALINEVQNNMRPFLGSGDYSDLDWAQATMDTRGNGAVLILVNSKSVQGKSLLYLKSSPSMYIWGNETHFVGD